MRMRPSEVLRRARESSVKIRKLTETKEILRALVGMQGHSSSFHSKNEIYDWTSRIDECDTKCREIDNEIEGCRQDIDQCWRIIYAMQLRETRLVDNALEQEASDKRESLFEEADAIALAVIVITDWCIYGRDIAQIAERCTITPKECDNIIKATYVWCDEQGMARLRTSIEHRLYGI